MKKFLFLVLSSALMSSILLGCQSESSISVDAVKTNLEQQAAEIEKLVPYKEITKISISQSKGNRSTVLDDPVAIEALKSIFLNATRENGIVNMAKPEFYIDVIFENESNQSLHLWIGNEGQKSTLMNTDDTHTIYTLSEEMNTKLIEFIKY